MAMQTILFRKYAIEATWIYAKMTLGIETVEDYRTMGSLCNSIKRKSCSIRFFKKIMAYDSSNLEAMANLGINYAMSGDYANARKYFQVYFSSEGRGFESAKWYAKALEELNQSDEAIYWYYYLMSNFKKYKFAAERLVSLLIQRDRKLEALSVIEQVRVDSKKYARKESQLINEIINDENYDRSLTSINSTEDKAEEIAKSLEIRIPSFDGLLFRIPQVSHSGVHFISVRDEGNRSQFSLKDMVSWGIQWTKISKSKARINEMKIGDWRLQDIEVDLCNECESYLGVRDLINKGAFIDVQGHVPFIVFQK